jgi:hypothetical protein
MTVPNDIILGDGVFGIGGTAGGTAFTTIALTRGGGVFTLEREFRKIEADGDYGPVKGRIGLIKETAKLNIKGLEIVPGDMDVYYPAISAGGTTGITATTVSLSSNVSTADYSSVRWSGYTKAGTAVVITLDNAINLENLNWNLVDKEEVINELTYTATYLETARNTAPWKIAWA